MVHNKTIRVEGINPYLLAMALELSGLNRPQRRAEPKPREPSKVLPISQAGTYNNQGNTYNPRQPQIDYSA